MSMQIGPRISDERFFSSLIDTAAPGLEKIPDAIASGDFKEARRLFANFVRSSLKPEYFNGFPYDVMQRNTTTLQGETWRESADRICNNYLISCGTPFQFGAVVDYFANPTFNKYKEWTWQLSRHSEWFILGYAYLKTGDEKYAKAFASQFNAWVKQATSPEPHTVDGGATLCWRTIEAGIRMGSNWQYVLHAFYKSPAFNDDMIADWYKSVWEHGERLYNDHRSGNWLLMEMDGLAQIGIIYPVLRDADRWRRFAVDMLGRQLDLQFYPDGMQYELSTSYHGVSVGCYFRLMRVARAYGVSMPDDFTLKLENTVAFYNKLIMPDFRLPDINDGTWEKAGVYVSRYMDFFPRRKDFIWMKTEGREGEPPPYISTALPYSGLIAMRTGWGAGAVWGMLEAAPFGRGHQHEDKLSFLMYMNGCRVLTEGGVYAYDDSEMRRYVLSTRSHNTIRVNRMDQNRRKNYVWADDDINKEAGMVYTINDEFDYAAGIYDEGYGPNAEHAASHERVVILIKRPPFADLPFFIVIDRLRADILNEYESLWHIGADSPILDGLNASMSEMSVFVSGADGMSAGIISGQEAPEWQGWTTDTGLQGDYRPAPALRYRWNAGDSRVVTLFYPAGNGVCPIIKIEASSSIGDTAMTILLRDGGRFVLDEQKYKP